MEQDFMGMRIVKVKKEVPEQHSAAPMMRWSFSNNAPGNNQFFSFDGANNEKPKTGFEALASTGLVTITTTEVVDSAPKSYSSFMQKNQALDSQGGNHYGVSSYTAKPFDSQSLRRPHESRVHPLTTPVNQSVSMTINSPVHQSFMSSARQNLMSPQPLSMTSSVPVVHSSPVVGTTDLRSSNKASGAPAQLTIFYNGSVCVYDDISPEKAQAIMLLAGNAPPMASSPPVSAVPIHSIPPLTAVPPPVVGPSIVDSYIANQSHSRSYSQKTSIPTTIPIPMTCQTPSLSGIATDATPLRSSIRTMASCSSGGEPSGQASSSGVSASAQLVPSGGVPQFRKASLARFLEKRKDRTLSASPYAVEKQSGDSGSPAASGSRSISVISVSSIN